MAHRCATIEVDIDEFNTEDLIAELKERGVYVPDPDEVLPISRELGLAEDCIARGEVIDCLFYLSLGLGNRFRNLHDLVCAAIAAARRAA